MGSSGPLQGGSRISERILVPTSIVATGTQMMKTTPEVGLGNYVSKFIQASDQARSYKITE